MRDAYNSGKPGNVTEFINYGILGEFDIYSANLSDAAAVFRDAV
jgi:hypothetical protein